jgi:P4 family phage/plasmid primase-like protien
MEQYNNSNIYLVGLKWTTQEMETPIVVPQKDFLKYITDMTEIKNKNGYEITFSNHTNWFSRVGIDIDGEFFGNETDFNDTHDAIVDCFNNMDLGVPHAVMNASKYQGKSKDGKILNVLSYRITITNKYGTTDEVRHYVSRTIVPKIKLCMKEKGIDIPILLDEKEPNTSYLNVDLSIYSKNRRMRCVNVWKEGEPSPRPFERNKGKTSDNLLTFIPEGCQRLEPAPVSKPSIPIINIPVKVIDEEKPTETKTDKVIVKILDALSLHRWNNYKDFIDIGMALYNEGQPLSLWEHYAKQGVKNKEGDCAKHWKNFRQGSLTRSTLFHMLKKDNPSVFAELLAERSDIHNLLRNPTHADVAKFFFNCLPNDYLYDDTTGWWEVNSNNQWSNISKGSPLTLRPALIKVFEKLLIEFRLVLTKQQLVKVDEDDKAGEEAIATLIKTCIKFETAIKTTGFQTSVMEQLRGYYAEQTRNILADKGIENIALLMDTNGYLFAFTDCLYDLKERKYREVLPTDFISINCGYKAPTTSNPEVRNAIIKNLISIWEDKEMFDYVMKVIANCVCGVRYVEGFFILTGRGGNGKGVLWELVQRAFGGYYCALSNKVLTKPIDNPQSASPEIAHLRGKRMAGTTEPEHNEKLLEGTIKQMTGGDVLNGRLLFKDIIKFKPSFGLFIQCNDIPLFNNLSGGGVRRNVVIDFPFQFVDKPTQPHHRIGDTAVKNIYAKTDEWRNEFIQYLFEVFPSIDGLSLDAIPTPQKIKDRTQKYTDENNAPFTWFKDNYRYTGNNDDVLVVNNLVSQYKLEDKTITAKEFSSVLKRNGVDAEKNQRRIKDRDGNDMKGKVVIFGWIEDIDDTPIQPQKCLIEKDL